MCRAPSLATNLSRSLDYSAPLGLSFRGVGWGNGVVLDGLQSPLSWPGAAVL